MKEATIGILATHTFILAFQFLLARMFPSQKRALFGIYFILLPAGFMFFMPPPPALAALLVVGGVIYVFYAANRSVALASRVEVRETTEV